MSDNTVKVMFVGGGEGPITFTANGHVYLAAKTPELQTLTVPVEDAIVLEKTDYFVRVEEEKVAAPKKAAPKKGAKK
jgi:DNA-binding IclR family transcriptional regulator